MSARARDRARARQNGEVYMTPADRAVLSLFAAMDASSPSDARVLRLERKVIRLESELKDARRKAASDLAAERRRSQYKIARVLNRRRDKTTPEPSECMICDERQGNIHHCKGPRACRNVICDRCAKDSRFDRRCMMCRSAGLNGLEQTRKGSTSTFMFGSGAGQHPNECAQM